MGINIKEFELTIDGEERNSVLSRYKDVDGVDYLKSLKDGYYPLNKDRGYIMDEEILKKVIRSFPNSFIFFRIRTDYGEEAYKASNGNIKKLRKRWS